MQLTPVQARVVGSLIEKELATPDNYPLSMNALLLACNQATARHPVMQLDEPTVSNALANLRAEQLVRIVYSRSNRVDKWRHALDEALAIERPALALLAVLMLRGPQTTAELRTRTERLNPFADVAELEDELRRLAGRPEPLAARLERQPGHKEPRWAQLLTGPPPSPEEWESSAGRDPVATGPGTAARLDALEARVAALEERLGTAGTLEA
ncbi:MAG TPA: DUF480 domain-containing protein [Acidimicrobiales bacterium]|nr:DUF480 domain-containing protein [Acidimicrobiales bacterium]